MSTLQTSPIDKCLHVGQHVIFYPESQRVGKHRMEAVIRGWQTGNYILLEVRMEHERSLVFHDGVECSLRFLYEGTAYAIEANLLSWKVSRREPHIRISWPRSVRSAAIRRQERLAVNIPCTIRHDGIATQGVIHNLSSGGCGITAACNAIPGSLFHVEFSLPDGIKIDGAPILVRTCKPFRNGEQYLGCSFRPGQHPGLTDIHFFVGTSVLRMRQQTGEGPQYLIVGSDNETMVDLRDSLDPTECLVVTAASLLDALVHARLIVPAFILIQYDWGGPTALDACRILRASPAHTQVPIFVFGKPAGSGGHSGQPLHEKLIKAGATDYYPELPPCNAVSSLLKNHTMASLSGTGASDTPHKTNPPNAQGSPE